MAQGHSADSLSNYRAQQSAFKSLPVGAPATPQQARSNPYYVRYGSRWNNSDSYFRDRNRYLDGLPADRAAYWRHPPPYVVNARPSYGSFSGSFMGSLAGAAVGTMIGNAMSYHVDDSYARWAYSHRNSSEYQQWHEDMMAQAGSDPDLGLRMAALDSAVNHEVQVGTAVDENALPDGVDPSMVVSADTVMMATSSASDADANSITEENQQPANNQPTGDNSSISTDN